MAADYHVKSKRKKELGSKIFLSMLYLQIPLNGICFKEKHEKQYFFEPNRSQSLNFEERALPLIIRISIFSFQSIRFVQFSYFINQSLLN